MDTQQILAASRMNEYHVIKSLKELSKRKLAAPQHRNDDWQSVRNEAKSWVTTA